MGSFLEGGTLCLEEIAIAIAIAMALAKAKRIKHIKLKQLFKCFTGFTGFILNASYTDKKTIYIYEENTDYRGRFLRG